jgi:hypothetical protein
MNIDENRIKSAYMQAYETILQEDDLPVGERRYFVEQGDEEGEYEVRKFHNENASESGFESKQDAIEAARDMAREASGPETKAQVKIRDGGTFSKVEDFVDGEKV